MTRQSAYSRREIFHVGAAGAAATIAAASGRDVAQAAVQTPPPLETAPRVLRKPPLDELQRIARSYGLKMSAEDLTSFRGLMDGVLASYRRLDQFADGSADESGRTSSGLGVGLHFRDHDGAPLFCRANRS